MVHRPLDIVFVNPSTRSEIYQGLGNRLAAIETPVWAGLLAKFARKRGRSVAILDAEAEGLTHKQAVQRVVEMRPKLVVIVIFGHQPSASTQNMAASGVVARELKNVAPDLPLLMVGGHPSALPERTLREEAVDYVCQGEGPHTIEALLQAIDGKRLEKLSEVPGLWYRRDGQLLSTPQAPLIQDMDGELGGAAFDLLPMDRYRAHNWHCFDHIDEREPYASIYTTLGCPYKCSFCCINAPFDGPSYRRRSPASVIEEIDLLVSRYGVKNIKIADEMFVLHMGHVEGICDAILARGYALNIWAYARVDTVKPRILDKLKRAGIRWLALGIESASEHVRDGVDKEFGEEDIRNTVRQIKEAGIHVIGNYIFGLPDDTHESMQQTLDMAIALNCEFANFYSAMAYPGSKLYGVALEKGWPLPERWSGYSQHAVDTLPLPTEHLPASEVLRFRDKGFEIYFKNPRYLDLVERKFGPKVLAHIREMTQHKLVRRFA